MWCDLRVVTAVPVLVLSVACRNAQSPMQPTPVIPSPSAASTTCCVLWGTVTADGIPVANALVDLLGTGQPGHYTFTRGDGTFRLPDTPKGAVIVRTGKWGYKTQVTSLVVDSDLNRVVTLQPGDAPVPLAFGKSVSSTVWLDDTICATSDPGVEDGDGGLGLVGPCKTFLLNVPQDGILVATATWPAPNMYLTMVTNLHGKCCSSPLTLRFPVTAGSAIELGISIHASDMLPLGTTAPFELTVMLER
jgi:Carboxypeptidase regulatory-like domain